MLRCCPYCGPIPAQPNTRSARINPVTRALDHLDSLTEREVEVLSAMPGGESNTDLAEYLGITERTVKFHVTNMREKLGGLSRAQLHLLALLTEAVWLCQTCRQKVPEKVLGGAPAVATELRVPAQRAPGSLLLAG